MLTLRHVLCDVFLIHSFNYHAGMMPSVALIKAVLCYLLYSSTHMCERMHEQESYPQLVLYLNLY